MELLGELFLLVGIFFVTWAYFICMPATAPWRSKEKRVAFWEKDWKDKFMWGILSIAFLVITPFMFYFLLIHDYIPNGEYRIRVDVSDYELPCDLIVTTEETEFLDRAGNTRRSYDKGYYLDMAYWPNGGQLKIDEYIDPNGYEFDVYSDGRIYSIKTPQITQELLGIDPNDLAKERLFTGNGVLLIVIEFAAVYVAVQFLCIWPSAQTNKKEEN